MSLSLNTQQVTTVEPSSGQPAVVDGMEVMRWLEHTFPLLHASAWGPLLRHEATDLLDAAIVELYTRTLTILRQHRTQSPPRTPGMVGRVRRQARLLVFKTKLFLEDRTTCRESAPLEHADILFWPCEPTHVKAMLPVIRWLGEQQISTTVFACRAKVFRELEAHGVQAIFPNAFWNEQLRQAGRRGRTQAAKLCTAKPFNLGNIRPLDDTAELVEMLRFQTANLLPRIFEAEVNIQQILQRIAPRTIVVGSDITFQGRIACRMAKAAGVPSACQMHGLVENSPMHWLHIADRYVAYGDNARQVLASVGFPSDHVSVCGAPYLDGHPKQLGHLHETIRTKLQLDDQRPYVLVAMSGPGNTVSHDHHDQLIEALCYLSVRLPNVQFVAKLHRKDRVEYYNRVIARVPDTKLRVIPYGAKGYPKDIFDWLQGSTALLTGASAVALEAMLMDVPVITMDFVNEIETIDFIVRGATTHVTTPDALIETVQSIVDSPGGAAELREKSEVYLQDIFLRRDGRSAERVGKELCRMAGLSN